MENSKTNKERLSEKAKADIHNYKIDLDVAHKEAGRKFMLEVLEWVLGETVAMTTPTVRYKQRDDCLAFEETLRKDIAVAIYNFLMQLAARVATVDAMAGRPTADDPQVELQAKALMISFQDNIEYMLAVNKAILENPKLTFAFGQMALEFKELAKQKKEPSWFSEAIKNAKPIRRNQKPSPSPAS